MNDKPENEPLGPLSELDGKSAAARVVAALTAMEDLPSSLTSLLPKAVKPEPVSEPAEPKPVYRPSYSSDPEVDAILKKSFAPLPSVATAKPEPLPRPEPLEVSRPELPKFELPKVELPKVEMPKVELPKVEMPKVELPKVEMPKVELPKVELPKVELPKVELPKVELPKVELPRMEVPRLEVAPPAPTKMEPTRVLPPVVVEAPKVEMPRVEPVKLSEPVRLDSPKVEHAGDLPTTGAATHIARDILQPKRRKSGVLAIAGLLVAGASTVVGIMAGNREASSTSVASKDDPLEKGKALLAQAVPRASAAAKEPVVESPKPPALLSEPILPVVPPVVSGDSPPLVPPVRPVVVTEETRTTLPVPVEPVKPDVAIPVIPDLTGRRTPEPMEIPAIRPVVLENKEEPRKPETKPVEPGAIEIPAIGSLPAPTPKVEEKKPIDIPSIPMTIPSLPEKPVEKPAIPSLPVEPVRPIESPLKPVESPLRPMETPAKPIDPPTPRPLPVAEKPPEPKPPASIRIEKPAGTSDVRPAGASESVRTDFDVDLHEMKGNDTLETISKQYYQDPRYARALREFNLRRGVDPVRGAWLQIPPIYILKKYHSNLIGPPRGSPEVAKTPASTPVRDPEWAPSR